MKTRKARKVVLQAFEHNDISIGRISLTVYLYNIFKLFNMSSESKKEKNCKNK